jgi:hypothetical protein
MSLASTFTIVAKVGFSDDFKTIFDPESEKSIVDKLNSVESKLKELFNNSESRKAIIQALSLLQVIEDVEDLVNYKVYLNEYSNKYGKKYIQARSSYENKSGKKAWVNAYVGPLDSFKGQLKDPEAIKLGKNLIRKKLIEKGICKVGEIF